MSLQSSSAEVSAEKSLGPLVWHYTDKDECKHELKISLLEIEGSREASIIVDAQALHLTKRERQCLALLVERRGSTTTKENFLNRLYPENLNQGGQVPDLKIVDVFICKIHKVLRDRNPDPLKQFLRGVWGRGWMISTSEGELPLRHEHETSSRPVLGSCAMMPDGNTFTLADLPSGERTRWVIRRKAMVAYAVRSGLLTLAEVIERHPSLSNAEYDRWCAQVNKHGLPGLRITRIMQYQA